MALLFQQMAVVIAIGVSSSTQPCLRLVSVGGFELCWLLIILGTVAKNMLFTKFHATRLWYDSTASHLRGKTMFYVTTE